MNNNPENILSVSLSNVGLLGELRWKSHDLTQKKIKNVSHLYDKQGSIITSRNAAYYARINCRDMISEISALLCIYKEIESECDCKPFLYIIADHVLCKSLRLIDYFMGISNEFDISELHTQYIDIVKWSAECIVCYLTNKKHPKLTVSIDKLPPKFESKIATGYPRVLIDGDNHVLALLTMQTKKVSTDLVVGIMLGGGSAAAIASAYYKTNLSYVKISKYDDPGKSNEVIFGYPINEKDEVVIIDDNCGTGNTFKEAKRIINKYSNRKVKLFPVELHWEKFLRTNVYGHKDSVFNINEIDYLSPFPFRHHSIIHKLITEKMKSSHKSEMTLDLWIDYSRSLICLLQDTLPAHTALSDLRDYLEYIKTNIPNEST